MKRHNAFFSVTLSALLLSCVFFKPIYFFWFVFIFLIPFYYSALKDPTQITLILGLWWGVFFFTLHFYDIILVLLQKAQGALRSTAAGLLIFYCALYVAVWFLTTKRLLLISQKSPWRGACLFITTFIYFYWLSSGIFWIFDSYMGYCFGSPLIVLAEYPALLAALPVIGQQGLLMCIIATQVLFSLGLVKREYRYFVLSFCCLLPFLYGLYGPKKITPPSYIQKLAYIQPPTSIEENIHRAEEINARIICLLRGKSGITTFLMPESSMQGSLNQQQEILDLWGANALADKSIHLIIGSYRTDNYKNVFVTLYNLAGSRIINYYDKLNLCPFTEFIPKFFKKNKIIRNLFLTNTNDFSSKGNCKVFFEIDSFCFLQPHLCSDLYFNNRFQAQAQAEEVVQLIAVNDSWFQHGYMKQLMYLYARFACLKSKHDGIYISHSCGRWISGATGQTVDL